MSADLPGPESSAGARGYTPGQEPRVSEGMVGGGRRFPMHTDRLDKRLPKTVPWELVAPHEAQAQRNHSQTLERLAQRGGLSVRELWSVCHDRHWHPMVAEEVAVEWLLALTRNGAQGYNGGTEERREPRATEA